MASIGLCFEISAFWQAATVTLIRSKLLLKSVKDSRHKCIIPLRSRRQMMRRHVACRLAPSVHVSARLRCEIAKMLQPAATSRRMHLPRTTVFYFYFYFCHSRPGQHKTNGPRAAFGAGTGRSASHPRHKTNSSKILQHTQAENPEMTELSFATAESIATTSCAERALPAPPTPPCLACTCMALKHVVGAAFPKPRCGLCGALEKRISTARVPRHDANPIWQLWAGQAG